MRLITTVLIANFISLFLVWAFGFWYFAKNAEDPKPQAGHCEYGIDLSHYQLNRTNVLREIIRNNIMFNEIVLRQTLVESGHYKSKNCLKRNNITGMKGEAKTSDNPEGYKIYPNWMECIKAYKVWQKERLTDDCNDYYQFLIDWGYHEGGENYERKCQGIKLVIIYVP